MQVYLITIDIHTQIKHNDQNPNLIFSKFQLQTTHLDEMSLTILILSKFIKKNIEDCSNPCTNIIIKDNKETYIGYNTNFIKVFK